MAGRLAESEAIFLSWSLILISFLVSDVQATLSSASYNLYSSRSAPEYSANRAPGRGKNWCAYIMKKNVTCTVVDGAQSYIKADYQPCPWGLANCPSVVVYRTHFRPTYKISYKVVTQLAWRCCPGFKGEDCKDGLSTRTAVSPLPSSDTRKRNLTPELPERQGHKEPSTDVQSLKIQQLEYEVQRLNQVLEKMQASLTGLGDSLRNSVQEDTSKTLATLLNNLRLSGSAVGFESVHGSTVHENGDAFHQSGMGEMMSKITEVKETLKTKSDMLDELHGMVSGHDGQLKQLMEAVQGPVSTYSPFSNGDFYQSYIDSKFETLKEEMMVGIDMKFADMKNSCEYRLMSLKEQCEENELQYENMEKLLHEKEDELRKEMSSIRKLLQESPGQYNCCVSTSTLKRQLNNMNKKISRVTDANMVLNARMDNELERFTTLNLENIFAERLEEIESRINVTERNAEEHCFYIEYTLRGLIDSEVDGVKDLLKKQLQVLRNKHDEDLAGLGNTTSTAAYGGELESLLQHDLNSSNMMEHLENRLQEIESVCQTGCISDPREMNNVKKDLETCKDNYKELLLKTKQNSVLVTSLNGTIHEGFKRVEENTDLEIVHKEINKLKLAMNTVENTVQTQWEGLNKSTEALVTIESTLMKKQQECLDKIYKLQETDRNLEMQLHRNESQLDEVKAQLEQLTGQMAKDLNKCKHNTQGIQKEVSHIDSKVAHIENVCSKLDNISGSLQRIKDGLNKHVSSLWNCVHHINKTVKSHTADIVTLKNPGVRFRTQVPKTAYKVDALPVQPIPVERGQAGPPGTPESSRLPSKTAKFLPATGTSRGVLREVGYAGPPGSADTSDNDESHRKQEQQSTPPPYGEKRVTKSTVVPKHVAFSVGLTKKPFMGNAGIIRFDKVLVNDGHHYDTNTGIFTAPFEGQYLITAVLAPQRNEHIEAILSVSNQSIMQMDTSGYQIELLESQRPFVRREICGGVGTFTLILNLKVGDEVSVIVIDGKLVNTDEMYSAFSGTLLYETSPQS
ncbi:EMILIN-2-like [Hypanus sabinus]|uniref:EMILIN-2-like n=1 Tax=Hypanus sabinus TaxID=79690 RepID=UPI0028C3A809|nr:EMILIN-2-like [Hypanus sabinus]